MIRTEKRNNGKDHIFRWAGVLLILTLLLWMTVWLPAGVRAEEETVQETEVPLFGEEEGGMHQTMQLDGAKLPAVSYGANGRSVVGAYYGSQLSENELAIYNALASASEAGEMLNYYYSTSGSNGLTVTLPEPYTISEKNYQNSYEWWSMQQEFSKATDAFVFDYSEEFWINGFTADVSTVSTTRSGKVTTKIQKIIIYPIEYYSEIRSEVSATKTALESLINSVKSKSSTKYEYLKNAHDAVAELITYPSVSTKELYANAWYHTITGALLDKYNHEAVCDGYARLFRLICQAGEISCVLVPGGSNLYSDGTVVMNHIWNLVKLDGQWYLVDVTWDDENKDPWQYFLIGSTADQDQHIPAGVFSYSSEYGEFQFPDLSTTDYERPTTDQTEETEETTTVTLSKSSLSLNCGQTASLTAVQKPASSGGYQLTWTSSNTKVAKVDSSTGSLHPRITAVKPGKATLKLTNGEGTVLASCKVTVKHKTAVKTVAATTKKDGYRLTYCSGCGTQIGEKTILPKYQVKLNVSSLPLQVKKSTTVLKIASYTSGDSVASWKSSNSQVVKVNSKTGKLTAKKKGTATITVTMKSGAKATCRVTVQKGTVKTKKLKVSPVSVTLKKGKTLTLKTEKTPLTSTQKITFQSSDKKVATVSAKGKITAKKKGTAYITVKSGSKKVKIKVTVE